MNKMLAFFVAMTLTQACWAVELTFDLLEWNDSQATLDLPSAVGVKPSPAFPADSDWLLFTSDDQQLSATYNPQGGLSHNFADITGVPGSGFNMAPSLSGAGAITLQLSRNGGGSWTVQVISLSYTGRATPIATLNQMLVTPNSPVAQNLSFNVDGVGNNGTWLSSAGGNWTLAYHLDFYFSTNVDGDPSPSDVDATFNDKPQMGYLIPAAYLTTEAMGNVEIEDPAGLFDGDFEQYLLDEIAPRLPQDVTHLLITQMAKTHPDYAELGLPITTASLIGNVTFAYTTQVIPACVPPDFDCDGDVDGDDLESFDACASGPAIPLTFDCKDKDLDGDNDVDQSDFGHVQRCYSGEANPADPTCTD